MGCICSKKKTRERSMSGVESTTASFAAPRPPALPKPAKQGVETEVYNILSVEQRVYHDVQCVGDIVSQKYYLSSQSLLKYPSSDELLAKCWIQKRGHVVRTWKKRYCVLEKSDLKYYADLQGTTPKGLKGGLALFGAVCVVKPAEDKVINVEIYGNYGEKDLLFYVDNNEEGQKFVRLLEWAIRKDTLTRLVRNLKTSAAGKAEARKSKTQGGKQACLGWMAHQESLFKAAIDNMKSIQLVQFINLDSSGSMTLRTGLIKLWSSLGEDHVPTVSTEAKDFGIAYQIITRQDYLSMTEGPFLDEAQLRIVTFADIEDIRFQALDATATTCLRQKVAAFHHPTCCSQNYIIVTIKTSFGYDLHLLACCLQDYQGFLLALQNAAVFIAKEQKLKAASTTTELKDLTAQAAVVTAMKLLAM